MQHTQKRRAARPGSTPRGSPAQQHFRQARPQGGPAQQPDRQARLSGMTGTRGPEASDNKQAQSSPVSRNLPLGVNLTEASAGLAESVRLAWQRPVPVCHTRLQRRAQEGSSGGARHQDGAAGAARRLRASCMQSTAARCMQAAPAPPRAARRSCRAGSFPQPPCRPAAGGSRHAVEGAGGDELPQAWLAAEGHARHRVRVACSMLGNKAGTDAVGLLLTVKEAEGDQRERVKRGGGVGWVCVCVCVCGGGGGGGGGQQVPAGPPPATRPREPEQCSAQLSCR